MKKIFFLTVLCFSAISCSQSPPPNPGFRIRTQIEVRQGGIPIPIDKIGTVTSGEFARVLPIQLPITGTEQRFTGKVSGLLASFDVPNGKTPATWLAHADSGWSISMTYQFISCNGQGTSIVAKAGEVITLVCQASGGFQFPFAPSSLDTNDTNPVELQAYIQNVNTDYGMPIFHFEDYTGTVLGTETATMVNGTDVRVTSSCLIGQPAGTYTVKVYNSIPPGATSGQPIGISSIMHK